MQNEIRKQCQSARRKMSSEERDIASGKIAETVIHSSWFQRCRTVACYLPMSVEVDTRRIIARAWRMKKRIFAPVTEKNDAMTFRHMSVGTPLYQNNFGLYEPGDEEIIDPRELDIVITPLVAFDSQNHRIGMGGGYFDRTFSFLRYRNAYLRPKLIGVAFACQEVEKIPANPWDIPLFGVITEDSEAN
jgi:5-formyltetrahydrofolate cyclo-ligase